MAETNHPIHFTVLICILCMTFSALAQQQHFEAGDFEGQLVLNEPVLVAVTPGFPTSFEEIIQIPFDTGFGDFTHKLNQVSTPRGFWLKVSLTNTSAEILRPYLLPGWWDEASIWLHRNGEAVPYHSDRAGFVSPFRLEDRFFMPAFNPIFHPGDTVTMILGVRNLRTNESNFNIKLQTAKQAEMVDLQSSAFSQGNRSFTLVFIAVLSFQVVLFFIYFLLYRRKEYLLYMGYLGTVVCYFIVRFDRFYQWDLLPDSWARLALLGYPIILLAYFAYLVFIRTFIRVHEVKPRLKPVFRIAEVIILIALVFFAITAIPEVGFTLVNAVYNIFFVTILLLSVTIFVQLIATATAQTRFILAGTGGLLIFLILGQVSLAFPGILPFDNFRANQFGVLFETIVFTSGLIFTGRWQELRLAQSQQQLIHEMREKGKLENRLEGLRQKVARDLHDDIGAMLSSISIYSQAAIERINAGEPDKAAPILVSMGNASREMVGHMRDMVWLIDPGNDSLPKLVERLETQASELTGHTGIRLQFESGPIPASATLDMAPRRNLVLIFREAMNNMLRHAEATRCHISIGMEKGIIHLEISDDGKGFDRSKLPRINGLNNIQIRASEMGSTLTIHSLPGEGTTIRLELPIPELEDFKSQNGDVI